MVGVIGTWDILAHPVVTIRCFGWGVFFRAVVSWQGGTFLSLLQDAGRFRAAASNVPTSWNAASTWRCGPSKSTGR